MKKFYYCLKENAEPNDEGDYDLYIDGDTLDWKYDSGNLHIHIGCDICDSIIKNCCEEEDYDDDDGNYSEDDYREYEDAIQEVVELSMLGEVFRDIFMAVDDIENDVQEIVRVLGGHSADDITIVAMEEPIFYE